MSVDNESNHMYYVALSILAKADMAIGAWKLSRLLSEQGIATSEASSGRLLRSMEDNGHVRSVGSAGRVITTKGEKVLKQWEDSRVRHETHMVFMNSLKMNDIQELTDVLIARRAIEAETAALAATMATEEEIVEMKRIINDQKKALSSGQSGVSQDAQFHRLIASASKNKILTAALDVIYHDPDIGKALESIRARVGSLMVEDHRKILNSIARRNPDSAKRAMIKHIQNVIKDLEDYFQEKKLGRVMINDGKR